MSDEIRRHVEHLHDELSKAADEGNTDADEVRGHVAGYLSSEEPADDDHNNLRERLDEAVVRFDNDHPSISGALQGVIDAFTAAGI